MQKQLSLAFVALALAFSGCGDDSTADETAATDGGESGSGGSGGKPTTGGTASGSSGSSHSGSAGTASAGEGTAGDVGTAGGGSGGATSPGGADSGPGGASAGGEPSAGGDGAGFPGPSAGGETGAGGDPGAGGNDGGAPVPVSSLIKQSITKQISPLDLNDPFLIEVGTLSFYPVALTNPQAIVPDGWVLSRVEEANSVCPSSEQGKERCRQYWRVYMYPKAGVCQLTKAQIQWSWDIVCAPGADCSTMPPDLVGPHTFTTTHSSEYFCEQEVDVGLFLPSSTILMPSTGTDPVTLRFFTTLESPYQFTAGDFSVPPGFALQSFTESDRDCDGDPFPHGCRQWWNAVIDPGTACTMSGPYSVSWDVSCAQNGNCDPSITTYTHNFSLVDKRNLCP